MSARDLIRQQQAVITTTAAEAAQGVMHATDYARTKRSGAPPSIPLITQELPVSARDLIRQQQAVITTTAAEAAQGVMHATDYARTKRSGAPPSILLITQEPPMSARDLIRQQQSVITTTAAEAAQGVMRATDYARTKRSGAPLLFPSSRKTAGVGA